MVAFLRGKCNYAQNLRYIQDKIKLIYKKRLTVKGNSARLEKPLKIGWQYILTVFFAKESILWHTGKIAVWKKWLSLKHIKD